jgi:mannose-6-phosphate isomerase-like protein (cupin superfamily)
LIRRGDKREINNTGSGPLKMLNVYVPTANAEDAEELAAGRA